MVHHCVSPAMPVVRSLWTAVSSLSAAIMLAAVFAFFTLALLLL